MPHYRISYFPEIAGKRTKFVIEEDALPFMLYVDKIRQMQKASKALPGMFKPHTGPIYIEQMTSCTLLHSGGSKEVSCYPPAIGDEALVYLIAANPIDELNEAREVRDSIGVVGADIPSTIRMLNNLKCNTDALVTRLVSKIKELKGGKNKTEQQEDGKNKTENQAEGTTCPTTPS